MGFRSLGRVALTAFVALSLVSLFADMTYEGSRSVLGSYLNILGGTAVAAGLIGIGEFLSHLMRLVGGVLAGALRSSRAYWALIFIGYFTNLVAVPLLAFAGRWEIAVALVFVERMGKGLRAPVRDVILAEITRGVGRGKGFGLHEVLDQVGAVAGPIVISWALYSTGLNYRFAFTILAFPAVAALLFLTLAYFNYPVVKSVKTRTADPRSDEEGEGKVGRVFWIYTAAMTLLSLGFVQWPIMAYHIKAASITSDYVIALMYTVAMAADAAVAYPAGMLYDRVGVKSLLPAPLLAIAVIPLTLQGDFTGVLSGSILWGVVMAFSETTMRAAVADMVPRRHIPHAYGVFGFTYGVAAMAGSVFIGFLYEYNAALILLFVVAVEAAAMILLATATTGAKQRRQ